VWDIFFIFFPSSFHPNSPPEEHPEAEESGKDSPPAVGSLWERTLLCSARSSLRPYVLCGGLGEEAVVARS
jgi:hypothetical protein